MSAFQDVSRANHDKEAVFRCTQCHMQEEVNRKQQETLRYEAVFEVEEIKFGVLVRSHYGMPNSRVLLLRVNGHEFPLEPGSPGIAKYSED